MLLDATENTSLTCLKSLREEGVDRAAAVSMLIMPKGTIFICDTHVNPGPSAEQIAGFTLLAANTVRRFGIEPKVAALSHSNFGSSQNANARRCVTLWTNQGPGWQLEIDGEMHSDAALSQDMRDVLVSDSKLSGQALLIMPSLMLPISPLMRCECWRMVWR